MMTSEMWLYVQYVIFVVLFLLNLWMLWQRKRRIIKMGAETWEVVDDGKFRPNHYKPWVNGKDIIEPGDTDGKH